MFNKEMMDIQSFFRKLLCKNAAQTSLIQLLLLKAVWISKLKVQNVIYWSYYIDNLNFMKKGNRDKEIKPAH